jgi:hypothetical protein
VVLILSTQIPDGVMTGHAAFVPLFLVATMASIAQAGEAIDAVQPFYDHPGLELEASACNRFVDPARRILDLNDAIKKGGEDGCLDPALAFDDADEDPYQIAVTLKLSESIEGDLAKVVAAFKADGEVSRLEWKLKRVDGAWKVADIVSMSKDWALSQFNCE